MSLEYKVSYREKDKGIQCIIAYKDNGEWKQTTKQGFKRQKDYKDWVTDTLEELKDIVSIPIEYRGMTFGEFRKIFAKDKEKEHSYNTKLVYDQAYEKFKGIDPIPLVEVGYIHLKPCFDKMLKEGISENTIKQYMGLIRATFNHAKDNYEIIKENPVKIKNYKFPIRSEKEKEMKVLTEKELDDLLFKLYNDEGYKAESDYWITFFAGKVGMRIGEINGLLDDGSIDTKNGDVNIVRQWKRVKKGNKYDLGSLKRTNSYRVTPYPLKYTSGIKEYLKSCVKDMNNRIFIDANNEATSKRLARKYKRYGYDITIHDLRHTYVTILIRKEFSFKTIAEFIGDTVETVIKVYSHFTDDMYEEGKAKINNL